MLKKIGSYLDRGCTDTRTNGDHDTQSKMKIDIHEITKKVASFVEKRIGTEKVPERITLGHLRLEKGFRIGEGTYGFVYKARCSDSGTAYAVKELACFSKKQADRVSAEADILMKIKCPRVLRVHDYSVNWTSCGAKIIIISEFCEGGDAFHIFRKLQMREIKISSIGFTSYNDFVTVLIKDMLEALSFLHNFRPPIIHRDIKLENILLSDLSQKIFKLADFGSFTRDIIDLSQLTQTGRSSFLLDIDRNTTPKYRPPEMVDKYSDQIVDEKCDMWMFGCAIHTLIFGVHPFEESSSLAIIHGVTRNDSQSRYPLDSLCHCAIYQDVSSALLTVDSRERPSAAECLIIIQSTPEDKDSSNFPGSSVFNKNTTKQSTESLNTAIDSLVLSHEEMYSTRNLTPDCCVRTDVNNIGQIHNTIERVREENREDESFDEIDPFSLFREFGNDLDIDSNTGSNWELELGEIIVEKSSGNHSLEDTPQSDMIHPLELTDTITNNLNLNPSDSVTDFSDDHQHANKYDGTLNDVDSTQNIVGDIHTEKSRENFPGPDEGLDFLTAGWD